MNATEQLAEISLGLRKTFDLTSLISSMATAALDTALTAKLPHFTEPVEQEIEKVSEDFAENLVGDAIMGTPLNLESWFEDELTSEIATKEATKGANYLDKLLKQKMPYQKANANGQGYHQTRSVGICYPNDYDPGWEAFKDLISQLDPKMSVKSTSAKKTPTRLEKKSPSLESYWDAAISGLPISPSDALKIALAAPGWLENLEDATEFYFKYMDGGWLASAPQAPTNSTHPSFFSSVGSYLESHVLLPAGVAALEMERYPLV